MCKMCKPHTSKGKERKQNKIEIIIKARFPPPPRRGHPPISTPSLPPLRHSESNHTLVSSYPRAFLPSYSSYLHSTSLIHLRFVYFIFSFTTKTKKIPRCCSFSPLSCPSPPHPLGLYTNARLGGEGGIIGTPRGLRH